MPRVMFMTGLRPFQLAPLQPNRMRLVPSVS
jgi:hypothetical protein